MRVNLSALMLGGLLFSHAAFGALVFSSDFTDPNNAGSVGGGILSGSASDVNINQGPWEGSYFGIATLLAAPQLTIATTGGFTGGVASITGLVRVNLLGLGLTDNPGWFFDNTGLTYQPNTLYTLTADVCIDGLISDLSVLSDNGVGIGLTLNGDNLFKATTDSLALVSLQALTGNFYKLTLQYSTGLAGPTGNIGIRLFNDPDLVANAGILESVKFSNVTLDATATPEPATSGLTGIALMAFGWWLKKRS